MWNLSRYNRHHQSFNELGNRQMDLSHVLKTMNKTYMNYNMCRQTEFPTYTASGMQPVWIRYDGFTLFLFIYSTRRYAKYQISTYHRSERAWDCFRFTSYRHNGWININKNSLWKVRILEWKKICLRVSISLHSISKIPT